MLTITTDLLRKFFKVLGSCQAYSELTAWISSLKMMPLVVFFEVLGSLCLFLGKSSNVWMIIVTCQPLFQINIGYYEVSSLYDDYNNFRSVSLRNVIILWFAEECFILNINISVSTPIYLKYFKNMTIQRKRINGISNVYCFKKTFLSKIIFFNCEDVW